MKIFIAHYSGEQSDAEDIEDHLKKIFRNQALEIFLYSSWESVAPGDTWEQKLMDALESTDALLVLMSVDALGRSWLNFEIGVAWAKKIRILIFCHKGLSISGLPRPYSSLQAVDINTFNRNERLDKIAKAVANALDLRFPTEIPAIADIDEVEQTEAVSFASTYRTWTLLPSRHIDEKIKGRFLVGAVNPSRPDRAIAAGLEPGETLYVRLFTGPSEEGSYIPALVTGENTSFFETVWRGKAKIDATLRLAASLDEGETTIPIMVIESFQKVLENE